MLQSLLKEMAYWNNKATGAVEVARILIEACLPCMALILTDPHPHPQAHRAPQTYMLKCNLCSRLRVRYP